MMDTIEQSAAELSRPEARLILRGREIVESGDLRRVREALRLSRVRMAALLGTSPVNVTNWELYSPATGGTMLPRPAMLVRIAQVVGDLQRVIDEERANTS
jgi:DNA-binding transcriptional regulator YiaG